MNSEELGSSVLLAPLLQPAWRAAKQGNLHITLLTVEKHSPIPLEAAAKEDEQGKDTLVPSTTLPLTTQGTEAKHFH